MSAFHRLWTHVVKKPQHRRGLAILSALEEFPHVLQQTKSIINSTKIEKSLLQNGIRVISHNIGASKIANVHIAVASGSQAENFAQKGAARVAGLSVFQGTPKSSALRLARNLENLGAQVKTYSDREKIVFEIKALPEKLNHAVGVVAESISSPAKPVYMIKEAKQIDSNAYLSLNANPKKQLIEYLHEAAYGELTPLGGSLYADHLDNLAEWEVSKFAAKTFVTGNIIVSGTGVSHDYLKQLVDTLFVAIPKGPATSTKSDYVGGDIRIRKDLGGTSYVGLAFPIGSTTSASVTRVLFELLSEKTKAESFFNEYADNGLFGFLFSGDSTQVSTELSNLISQIKLLSKESPDIAKYKKKLHLESKLALESELAASTILQSTLHDTDSSTFDEVTSKEVIQAATQILKSNPSYVVLGKTYGIPTLSSVLKSFI